MRNILALIFLAVLLTGCQYSTDRRNPPPANTSWNDQNSAPRFPYRQALARADDPGDFSPGRMAGNDPDMEDPGPPPNRRQLRRAYRQALARADDSPGFGQGPLASDSADGEDPAYWRQQNRLARRAYRQAQAHAEATSEIGQYPVVSDAVDMNDPTPWDNRDNLPRRTYSQALARADSRYGFSQDSAPSDARWGNDRLSSLKTVTLQSGGRARSYLIYVPSGYRAGQPIPLVLVFHGGGGNAMGIARTTNMHQLAEQYTFIVVYPNGTATQRSYRQSWNAGSSPPQGYAEEQNVDDVGFVKTILQQVKQSYAIDPNRVYATGLSKGAMLTYRLACELSDQFAAIAPVAGTLTYNSCRPTRSIAILHIHGSNDQNVPLEGGGRTPFSARNANYPSPLQGLNRWRQQNHCAASPTQTAVTADTARFAYSGCNNNAEVIYYIVRNGGHGWPGSIPKPKQRERGIYISNQLNASAEIWNFFAKHPKP